MAACQPVPAVEPLLVNRKVSAPDVCSRFVHYERNRVITADGAFNGPLLKANKNDRMSIFVSNSINDTAFDESVSVVSAPNHRVPL